MTYYCESCRYYNVVGRDEFAGPVGQCRINPPTYNWNNHQDLNNFPRVKASAWCGQWKGK